MRKYNWKLQYIYIYPFLWIYICKPEFNRYRSSFSLTSWTRSPKGESSTRFPVSHSMMQLLSLQPLFPDWWKCDQGCRCGSLFFSYFYWLSPSVVIGWWRMYFFFVIFEHANQSLFHSRLNFLRAINKYIRYLHYLPRKGIGKLHVELLL